MNLSPRSPRGARVLGALVLLAAFVAGGIAATAIDRVLQADPAEARAGAEECDEPRPRLLDQVGLSAEQRETIDGIFERRRAQTDSLWKEARPRLDSIMDSTRAEIRAVLTPEQRSEYERLRRERKAEKAAREAASDCEGERDR